MRTSRRPEDLGAFLSDESRLEGGTADEVAWPESVLEISTLLKRAQAEGTPVTISGGGTGVVGGRIPQGGLVIATDRFDAIGPWREFPDGTATVRAGAAVTLAAVQEAAAARGWFYPPDPTEAGSWIGGNVATNASGARTFRFGPTRAWIAGLTVVLPEGTILALERGRIRAENGRFTIPRDGAAPLVVPAPTWTTPRTSKHVAGYYSEAGMDLVDLFIGSEGTLGVVVDADLRLVRAPEEILTGILFFPDESSAFAFVDAARDPRDLRIEPMCLEFFAESALTLLRGQGVDIPADGHAAIFFEQPSRRSDLDDCMAAWIELAAAHGASEASWIAEGPSDHRKFREFRHLVPVTINETLARRKVRKVSTDTAVPRGALPEMLARFRAEMDRHGLEHVEFGHVGNDHVHVNIVPRDAAEQALARSLYDRLIEIALELGGSISGEHGLGRTKARYLARQYPPAVIDEMRAIKRALDPAGILGRGVLFAPDARA